MERDSIIYKTRRKMQVFAHKALPDELMSKIYFRIIMKKKLNIKEAQTFEEAKRALEEKDAEKQAEEKQDFEHDKKEFEEEKKELNEEEHQTSSTDDSDDQPK